MDGDTAPKPASLCQWRGRSAWRRERARLIDATEFLRIALRPAARQRGVVVDEYERAIIDGLAFEDGFDQDKGFTVLITGRVRQLVVRTGKLPVKKPEEGAPLGFRVGQEARWKKRLDRVLIGPVFDCDAIARVGPRRKRDQCR